MTFLHLGEAVYVRNPDPSLAEYFAEPYQEHSELPADAVDTGFERGGEHLRQLVSAGWLRATSRGSYAVPPDRVIPLLTILTAARR